MRVRAALTAALVVTTVAGVVGIANRQRQASFPVPQAAPPGMSLEPCTHTIEGVRYRADCGSLVVPEHRDGPARRTVVLPVRRIRAASPRPREPVFFLAGGPGISNMGFEPPAWLLADHDVVLVGYRGVDGIPKLDCPEVERAITGTGGDLLSPESLDRMGAAVQACAQRLQAVGIDLAGYTIPAVVEDIEAARVELGYARVNLLSESYGTRVAQIYGLMHPGSVLRSAMIGVNPPGRFVWLPEKVDTQLEYYAELCRRDVQCRGRMPDLAATIRAVNRDMPRRWLMFDIDPGKVKVIAFVLLYHRSTAPIVFDAYLAAAGGDPSGLALMSLAYDVLVPGAMTWGEFFALGASADYEPGRDYRADLARPDATLGAPMSLLIWGSASGRWPPVLMAEEYRRVKASAVETLLVSGSVDFATPAEYAAEELLPFLPNGRHLVIAEQGHSDDFWSFQRAAAERLLTSFYASGVADDSLYTNLPMDFEPPLRLPLLAKLTLALAALLTALLGAAVWLIARRIRRRRAANRTDRRTSSTRAA